MRSKFLQRIKLLILCVIISLIYGGEIDMFKGIFWCYVICFDFDMYTHNLITVKVPCDGDGNPLEKADFSSKSGDNFVHKIEWDKILEKNRFNHPYNFYPRGRVEINNGRIRIYANPVIICDEEARGLIVKTFELKEREKEIKWIADNSKHYQYDIDAMSLIKEE